MKLQRRWLAAAISSAVVAVSAVALTSSGVSAAGTIDPSITGDPNAANGTIAFYDAAGNQITSGPLSAPFAAYAVASSPTQKTGTIKATLFVATPDHTKSNSLQWFNQQLTAASSYPLKTSNGVPASVVAAEGSNPAVAVASSDGNLAGAFAGATNDATAGFDHFMQVRLEDSGIGKPVGPPFWATDIFIDTTAGTWTQVYPAVATKTSTTVGAISANPASPAAHGSTVTLTSTVSASDGSHPAGSVELFDGSTDKGAATFDAATGAVSKTDTPADGSHSYTFKFTPSDTGTYSGSTSAALAYTVSAPIATTTTLTANPASPSTVGDAVTLTATVSVPAAAGTVQFKDGSANLGSPVTVSGGTASTTTSSLTVGTHSLTAVFAPTSSAYTGSTSSALSYRVNAAPAAPTTTTLAVSPAGPVDFGTPVTLTAGVSPTAAVGTVQFYDGTTALGSPVTVASGSASSTVSTLASGSHSLTAKFIPTDPTLYGTSTSAASSLTVNAQSTTTTLTAPAGPVDRGTAVALSATIVPASAVGTVQFLDGSTPIGSPVAVSGGKASTSTSALTVGSHDLSAAFTPTDASKFAASTSTVSTLVVQNPPPGQTTTGLTVNPAGPITEGDTATLKATITPAAAAGSVTFSEDGTPIGSPVTVTGGTASLPITPAVGTHSYTASFASADITSYADSASSAVSLVVRAPATKTATTLAVNPAGPVDYGTSVTFTATVSAANAGDPAPTGGSVKFAEGSTVLGTAALTGGQASFSTSTLGGGAHSVMAIYVPADATLFAASRSTAASITVNAQPTSTTLAVSATGGRVTDGDAVTLTATLTPSTATGSVSFVDGSTSLGNATVAGGQAVFSTSMLAIGDHSLTAVFTPADAAVFDPSTSAAVPLTVVAAPTLEQVTVNGQPVSSGATLKPGAQVTLTAQGFQPNESVSVILKSTPITLATTTADASGSVKVTVTLPADLAAGSHTLTLHGSLADSVFSFKVAAVAVSSTPTPTASASSVPGATTSEPGTSSGSGGLASTGAVLLPVLGAAGLFLLAGLAFVTGARRRRAH